MLGIVSNSTFQPGDVVGGFLEGSLIVSKNDVEAVTFGSLVIEIRLKTVNNTLQDGFLNGPSGLEV